MLQMSSSWSYFRKLQQKSSLRKMCRIAREHAQKRQTHHLHVPTVKATTPSGKLLQVSSTASFPIQKEQLETKKCICTTSYFLQPLSLPPRPYNAPKNLYPHHISPHNLQAKPLICKSSIPQPHPQTQ